MTSRLCWKLGGENLKIEATHSPEAKEPTQSRPSKDSEPGSAECSPGPSSCKEKEALKTTWGVIGGLHLAALKPKDYRFKETSERKESMASE